MATHEKRSQMQFKWRGEYDNTAAYVPLDVVTYKNTLYLCGVSAQGVPPDAMTNSSATSGYTYWHRALPGFSLADFYAPGDGFAPLQLFAISGHLETIKQRSSVSVSQPDFWNYVCSEIY